jgi:hypothetical protein
MNSLISYANTKMFIFYSKHSAWQCVWMQLAWLVEGVLADITLKLLIQLQI